MDSLAVIFDISSDDDDQPCCHEPEGDDYDWLSEVLKSVDNDSDDVVVVSEVNHRKRARLSKPVEDDFDDDCVILDGDPEKSDGAVNEPEAESDDLLIVGEKGQVACRDFPHSRQHCAKFPFNSTPHERHCNLCHCYVCDSIAPCKYWGKGNSNYDHCHAIEKEERWKFQRENHKNRERPPPSVPKLPYASHSMSQPQNQIRRCSQVPNYNNVPPSTVVQNQVSRPTLIRACTSSASNPIIQNQVSKPALVLTSFGTPRVRNHGKRYLADHFLARNRNHRHLVSQQPSNDFIIQKERDHSIGRPGARYIPQRTFQRYPPMQASNDRSGRLGTGTSVNPQPGTSPAQNFSQTSTGNTFLNTVPFQPNADKNIYQPVDQTENVRNLTFPESQTQGNQQPPVDNLPLPASCDQTLPEFEIEKWLLDNDTLQDGLGAPADAGMLDFDFEEWLLGNE